MPGYLWEPIGLLIEAMEDVRNNLNVETNPSQGRRYYRITPLEEGVAPPWPGNVRGPTLCGATLTFS